MNLEDQPKYDRDFIKKVGGLLCMLYENYASDDIRFDNTPFHGETFENVYRRTKGLIEHECLPLAVFEFWTEERARYLASLLVHWNYMSKAKFKSMSKLLETKDEEEKMVLKWALTNGHYQNYGTIFDKLVDMFGLEDKSWIPTVIYTNSVNTWLSANELKECRNLINLRMYHQHIPDLSPLLSLTNLQVLAIHKCRRGTDFSPVASLTNLVDLDLQCNHLIDLSFVSGLTNLKILYLVGNKVTDISPIANLTKLTTLYLCDDNMDFSPISGLINLTYLDITYSKHMTNLSFVDRLVNLTYLKLEYNQIVDISHVANLTNLTYLNLRHNQIVDISPLTNLTKLKRVYLQGNNIIDQTPIMYLNLENNPFEDEEYE